MQPWFPGRARRAGGGYRSVTTMLTVPAVSVQDPMSLAHRGGRPGPLWGAFDGRIAITCSISASVKPACLRIAVRWSSVPDLIASRSSGGIFRNFMKLMEGGLDFLSGAASPSFAAADDTSL